jgi:hypothetical protein
MAEMDATLQTVAELPSLIEILERYPEFKFDEHPEPAIGSDDKVAPLTVCEE